MSEEPVAWGESKGRASALHAFEQWTSLDITSVDGAAPCQVTPEQLAGCSPWPWC